MIRDQKFEAQKKVVFEAFRRNPVTMLMIEVETGIMRSNITRYVAEWKKENKIHLLKKDRCPISKQQAGYYTTNPILFPKKTLTVEQKKIWV